MPSTELTQRNVLIGAATLAVVVVIAAVALRHLGSGSSGFSGEKPWFGRCADVSGRAARSAPLCASGDLGRFEATCGAGAGMPERGQSGERVWHETRPDTCGKRGETFGRFGAHGAYSRHPPGVYGGRHAAVHAMMAAGAPADAAMGLAAGIREAHTVGGLALDAPCGCCGAPPTVPCYCDCAACRRRGNATRAGFRSGPSCVCCGTERANCACNSGCYCRRDGSCPVSGGTGGSAAAAFRAGPPCPCCAQPAADCVCPAMCACRGATCPAASLAPAPRRPM